MSVSSTGTNFGHIGSTISFIMLKQNLLGMEEQGKATGRRGSTDMPFSIDTVLNFENNI